MGLDKNYIVILLKCRKLYIYFFQIFKNMIVLVALWVMAFFFS